MTSEDKIFNSFLYQQKYMVESVKKEQQKKDNLLEKINNFKTVSSLKDAKLMLNNLFAESKEEKTQIIENNIECTILNTDTLLRICVDTPRNFISYEFVQ